jgi:hypothetical protein
MYHEELYNLLYQLIILERTKKNEVDMSSITLLNSRNPCRILAKEHTGGSYVEKIGVDGRIILN